MSNSNFKGYLIAIAIGALLMFVTLRFLGFGVGVSDATELDWASCEVEAELHPRGGPLQDIRCDDTNIMFETWSSGRERDTSTNMRSDRESLNAMANAMRETYQFSSWKRNNEDIQVSGEPRVVNGFLSTRFNLIDITAEGEAADHGRGLLAVVSQGKTTFSALCISRTETDELCEGAIADIFEAKETAFSDKFSSLPEGIEAQGEAAAREDEESAVEPEPVKELTASERMELVKRGEQLYLTQCASCHNVGMTRAPSAPKMGSNFWRGALSEGTGDLIEAAKVKCKDERDGDGFSHTITEREMAMALQHVLMKSSAR